MSLKPPPTKKLKHFIAPLAKPHVLFYALPWLMILIAVGTITQKELGLYAATEKYINSLILWLGPVPLPGGLLTIGIIFVALLVKFIFFSKWNWKQSGIILTHLGVLVLLLGGLITTSVAREGFMIIPEGQNISNFADYKKRVVIFSQNNVDQKTISFSDIKTNEALDFEGLKIKILMRCDNCGARAPSGKYEDLQGLAINMELYDIPPEKNIEANFSGLIFELLEAPDQNLLGTYIVMEDIPKNPIFEIENKKIEVKLQRQKEELPFSITLKDFRKIDYPGTTKAREYESDLIIQDNDLSWETTISMNEPLRYKGYTFYQSSFEQRPDVEVTVLNVVTNAGWLFPYISTLIIFLGLLIHLIVRLQQKKVRT